MNKAWTNLNLSSLKYFVDAIKLASLTKAADVNHVSRPAISQAIRRIEEQIGFHLLTHQKRQLHLTQKGRIFYDKALKALEAFNSSLNEDLNLQNNFNIACSATIAEYIVLPLLQKLKLNKDIQWKIRIGTSAKVRQLVSDGESHLGILIDDEKTFGFDQSLLKRGEFVIQSRTGNLEFPLITTEPRPEVLEALKSLAVRKATESQSHLEIESWSVCRKTAELVGGSCLVPDLIPLKSFKKVKIRQFKYEYRLIAITKNKHQLSDLENHFFNLNLKS